MSASTARQSSIIAAASRWASAAGFADATAVPLVRLGELVSAVAAATGTSAAETRDAILVASAEASERAAGSRAALGEVTTTAARAQSQQPPTPAALRVRQQLLGVAAPAEQRRFADAVAELSSMRFAITPKASPAALAELGEAASLVWARLREVAHSHADAQAKEELTRLHEDLVSRFAKDQGIFLVPADAPVALGGAAVAPTLSRASLVLHDGKAAVIEHRGEVRELLGLEEVARRFRPSETVRLPKGVALADPSALDPLRSLTDAELHKLGRVVTPVTLEQEGAFARVLPTKWHRAGRFMRRRVVCEGPFRGIYLDDLVQVLSARGQRFAYDPKTNTKKAMPALPGEPVVTEATLRLRGEKVRRLLVRVPYDEQWTSVRRALRRLAALEPSVRYRRDSKNTSFYFPVELFGTVQEVVRTFSVSEPALAALEAHFGAIDRLAQATAPAQLERHTMAAIGGFKKERVGLDGSSRPLEYSTAQRRALAWLSARDYRGVVAMDTGMGKTAVAIGALLELQKAGEKRPFLVVAPPALRGNMHKEIHSLLEPKAAEALLARLRVISYAELTRLVRDKKLDPKRYGAIVYDEAQWLNKPSSPRTRAALSLKHPRTICLSASPIDKSPVEAYVMYCVASGIDLNDRREGKEHRWQMRKFLRLCCDFVGGRIVGIKDKVELMPGRVVDPKLPLYNWFLSNFFAADKRDDDVKLPQLTARQEVLEMSPELEREYRKKSHRIAAVMRGMVAMFRDKGLVREYVDATGRTRREMSPLVRNKRIAQMFGVRLRGVIAKLNALTDNAQKLDRAAELVWKHLEQEPSTRFALFSDSPAYVWQSAERLSAKIPGKLHAACSGSEIRLFRNGVQLESFAGHALPFATRAYAGKDRTYEPQEWQQFVFDEILAPNREVASVTMLGPAYQQGHNLQWLNVGFHLDRDTWSSENLAQREARLWRKGQTRPVTFYTLDWVYRRPIDNYDHTLDEIRRFVTDVGEALVRDLVDAPQKSVRLGSEWAPPRSTSAVRPTPGLWRIGIAPTVERIARQGEL